MCGLSCSEACGSFVPWPGIELSSLHWKVDAWPLDPKEVPGVQVFLKIIIYFMCLLSAALCLHYCVRAFFSCEDWALLSSCGVQPSHCGGFSCPGAWAPGHTGVSGCRTWAQQLCCAHLVCGIFQDQGSNWYPLHCKVDSQPLDHQGSPWTSVLVSIHILHHYHCNQD